jgi:hypothetical protein
MSTRRKPAARWRFFAAAYISIMVLSAAPALAQSSGRSPIERDLRERNDDLMREMQIRQREGVIKTGTVKGAAPASACEGCRDDFRRLQIVNNEMMRATFSDETSSTLDYRRISEATAEINRRASRLKANLLFPKPEREEQRPKVEDISNDKQLKASLLVLDKLIMGFVNNPVFRSGTVDAQRSVKAGQDLLRIIELSRAVKLGAEKLSRSRD